MLNINKEKKYKKIGKDQSKEYNTFLTEVSEDKIGSKILALYDMGLFTYHDLLFELAHHFFLWYKACRPEPLEISKEAYDLIKDLIPEDAELLEVNDDKM